MLAFAHGDRDAFDELFVRYRQPIYAFYRRRVGEQARAEELTQETFLALLRSAGRYEPRALFRTYLFAIAFRILSAERRKNALRSLFFLPELTSEPSRQDCPEDVLWLKQGLGRLERTDREIVMLREFDQLSYAEIADVMRLPLNTVRSRLFRARVALRENLKGLKVEKVAAVGETS